jgi:hypothetical protein
MIIQTHDFTAYPFGFTLVYNGEEVMPVELQTEIIERVYDHLEPTKAPVMNFQIDFPQLGFGFSVACDGKIRREHLVRLCKITGIAWLHDGPEFSFVVEVAEAPSKPFVCEIRDAEIFGCN